ncbi:MAG: 3',5'-cyclic-nucleotide phosphodiesterase [Betaproteobacteria bacterium]|nr:3',5'-cyclic-nucleotide phosphodiesterase [Betaproteobacteria bacterium]
MIIKVLGASGGIGEQAPTTSLRVDDDILIDAGTGVETLRLAEAARIDHVFVTHAHLDHTVGLAFLADAVGAARARPMVVHALPQTIDALRRHIFNGHIWPDFSVIPDARHPYLAFAPVALRQAIELGNGRRITPLPAEHTVPAVGYHLQGTRASLVFSGDTFGCDAFWECVNAICDLRYLLIETAFPDRLAELARRSKHLHPARLKDELNKLAHAADIFICHQKPGDVEAIMDQIGTRLRGMAVKPLEPGATFDI